MLYELFKNKKIKVGLIVFLIISIIAIIVGVFVYNRDPFTGEQQIQNIDEFTRGKPSDKDTLRYIRHELHEIIKLNTSDSLKNNSIKDIFIRKNSYYQSLDNKRNIYTVKFIVDIASLKQSYAVSYQWHQSNSALNEDNPLDEYGTVVTCPDKKDLVYGDFKCKDMFTIQGESEDPVFKRLEEVKSPSTYRVYGVYDEGSKKIIAQIFANTDTERAQMQFEQYRSEVRRWLQSENIDTTGYYIEWRNLSNEIIPENYDAVPN